MSREIYGPLPASWAISFAGERLGGTTMVSTYDRARSTVAYFLREGRRSTVVRTEHCPASGCNGEGVRSVHRRGRVGAADVPCVSCRGTHDTVEDVPVPVICGGDTMNSVLGALAMHATSLPAEYQGAPARYEVACAATGWPMHRGTMLSILDWLRETGRVL